VCFVSDVSRTGCGFPSSVHSPTGLDALRNRALQSKKNKNHREIWVPVAHACNPSYSGGRDQEALRANSSRDPISKKIHYRKKKKGWWSDSRYRP
jgi:hypothetical protein